MVPPDHKSPGDICSGSNSFSYQDLGVLFMYLGVCYLLEVLNISIQDGVSPPHIQGNRVQKQGEWSSHSVSFIIKVRFCLKSTFATLKSSL